MRAHNSSDRDARVAVNRKRRIAEYVEDELERLRDLRPRLESRIARAAHLLVVHLSDPRQGTIHVRVSADRRPRFVVRSLTSPGLYVVDPEVWSCSCPDFHRRGAACKHALAAWCLKRAADRGERGKGCAQCIDGWVYMGEDVIDSE